MATPTNHWKLGLFVAIGLLIGVGVVVVLGARTMNKETVSYVSYFDESVQGLEIGSPVKFRGVTIGTVSNIDIASDVRHVEITSELIVTRLQRMNLGVAADRGHLNVHSKLRVQLTSTGITGVKFILIDFFDPKANPAPTLPFVVPANYIPSTPSTMKNIEEALVRTVQSFPEVSAELLKTLGKINGVLDGFDEAKLPEQAAATFSDTSRTMKQLERQLEQFESGKISKQALDNLANLNVTLKRLDKVLARVEGERGLLASTQRATDALGDVARNANGLSPELEDTLRDVKSAAQSIRRLADAIERDPDMLLKGRASATR